MLGRIVNAVRHSWTVLTALPNRRWRSVLREGWRVERELPRLLEGHTIPKMMEVLSPRGRGPVEPPAAERDRIRALADAAVAFNWRSKYGLCLRRSLVRYYLLREAGVPVSICFGARKHAGTVLAQAKLTGHAWLTLHGIPYAEDHPHYRDFTVMFRYPDVQQLELKLE